MPGSRVAVGSIFVECNHFGGEPTTLDSFRRYEYRHGEQVFDAPTGAVRGLIQSLRQRVEILPLLVATANSGGPITADCYAQLKQELITRLTPLLPVDGVALALHGASTSDQVPDPEGDLLKAVRELIGPDPFIVVTLDHHAHVTGEMMQSTDAIVAWETYPHRDAETTGARGARLLLEMLEGKLRPTMAMAKVPVLVSGVNGHTEGPGPFADVMRAAKSLEGVGPIVSTSMFLVHPYLDLADMGGGGLVITHDDHSLAVERAGELARQYWDRRHELEPQVCSPREAIAQASAIRNGTIVLVETADCCGGGAAGDSVHTLRELLSVCPNESSIVGVVDPLAARQCHQAGVGTTVGLNLGHQLDRRWGAPLVLEGVVETLHPGKFRYTGGIWDGQWADMGPSAVVRVKGAQILIMSHATYDWRDEQFRAAGLDPGRARFVVAKNPMNFRMAYAPIAVASFILDTPGPTPATLRHVNYQMLKRPYFPRDADIPGLVPTILLGNQRAK